ncbi:hypothetical protein O181_008841 [Austropuccinia psidii MF-1]|uniref:Uncharacterized protein n=1 Tax=Austropuccinia psidii MF-1 TaxID=1389203 RepID=A0A9Q3BN79_9BASI|nr:hypothetical protein [Austropuccinia psidii MF-1]
MTKDYASRRTQGGRLCTSRVWGNNSIYGSFKVLNVGLQGPLGPQSSIQDVPFNSGGGHPPDGPGPRPCRLKLAQGHIFGPLDPLKPHKTWAWETPIAPMECGLHHAAHGM